MTLIGLLVLVSLLSTLLLVSWKKGFFFPVVAAVVIQIALSSIILNTMGFQGDASTYFGQATEIYDKWSQGQLASNPQTLGKMSILWLIAGLYLLTGPTVSLALVLLCIFIAFVPLLIGLATREFGFHSASTVAAWLGALSPPVIFWGSWIQRESISFPILALGLWGISRVYRGKIVSGASVALFSVALLIISRPQLIPPIAVGLVVAQIFSHRAAPRINVRRDIGVLLVAIAMMASFYWSPTSSSVIDAEVRQRVMYSNAHPTQNTAIILPPGDPSRLPLAMFGPFPSQWTDRSWTIIGLDGFAWLMLTLGILYLVIRHRDTRRMSAICSAMAMVIFVGLAMSLANYGLALRVRAHAWVILIPVVAVLTTSLFQDYRRNQFSFNARSRFRSSRNSHKDAPVVKGAKSDG